MLTCAEFKCLDESLQAQFLWLDGVLLMTRKTRRLGVELFALYGFYVEVFFDQRTEDPLYLKAFNDTGLLEVYLEEISIEPALANDGTDGYE